MTKHLYASVLLKYRGLGLVLVHVRACCVGDNQEFGAWVGLLELLELVLANALAYSFTGKVCSEPLRGPADKLGTD